MSKTLGQIIAVGVAIGINVIPGVGQAISGAIATSLYGVGVAAGTAVAIGSAISTAITLGVTAYGTQSGASLLGLGPNIPKPDTTVTAIKGPRPARVSAYGRSRLYGAYALFETAGNGTAVDVFAFHDGEADGIELVYLGDRQVGTGAGTIFGLADGMFGGGNVSVDLRLGLPTETAFSAVTGLLPGEWSTDHRGDGVVTGCVTWRAVKSKDYLETYPNGQPPLSLVARWQKCPDPRESNWTDPDNWTWTENAVRHLLHYKIVREGVDPDTELITTLAYWQAACDDADDATALKAGGTEPRYRSCLAHKHVDAHKDVTAALLSTFDGWIAPRPDGALIVYSGRYTPPTISVGPDMIVSYSWDGVAVDDDKAVNEIICSYVSADHDYNTVETDAWRDEDDIAGRGQILSTGLDAQVPSWGQARRLAKRKMARTNAPDRGTVTTNVAGRIVRGHRYIDLHIEEAGAVFYSGPAEITALTRNMSSGGVTFSWVAADPNIDDWNPATEEGDPAAKGDRVAPEPLDTPTIISATPDYSPVGQNPDGEDETGDPVDGGQSTGARILIVADGPIRDDLTWYARWRVGVSGPWNEREYPDADPGPGVSLKTEFVPIAPDINVEVAYSVGDGRLSPWSLASVVDTTGA